jgi:hypothetical protein
MERVLFDEIVRTDYGQFEIGWMGNGFDGDFGRFFAGQVNGLVGASDPGGLYVNLARRSGGSPARIVLLEAMPKNDADTRWEDVVEVSFVLPEGHDMRWSSWAGESGGALAAVPPDSYRLRASAKGRDRGREGEFSDNPVDFYLLQMWPAPPQGHRRQSCSLIRRRVTPAPLRSLPHEDQPMEPPGRPVSDPLACFRTASNIVT